MPPWDTLPQMMSSAVESYTNNPLFGTKNLVTGAFTMTCCPVLCRAPQCVSRTAICRGHYTASTLAIAHPKIGLVSLGGTCECSLTLWAFVGVSPVWITGEYQWMTYGEFGELYARFRAGLLQRTDVKKGDKIAIVSKNRVSLLLPCSCRAAGSSFGENSVLFVMVVGGRGLL